MYTKPFLTAVLLVFIVALSFGQTQDQMNQKAHDNYQKADKELNTSYNKILKEYKKDTEFIKNIKKSQKIWISFRDAEMRVKYPNRGSGTYGSVHQMCWYNYLTKLTKKRTDEIKVWLTGVKEGEVCGGSVKMK
jgi:uncharacterized protein YecT (DUF1311 family)